MFDNQDAWRFGSSFPTPSGEDQVLALRLQTLASTRIGLQVYVPSASTRGRGLAQSGREIEELRDANLVLAIISRDVSSTVQKELGFAQQLGRPIVPIVLGDAEVTGLKPGQPVFHIDSRKSGGIGAGDCGISWQGTSQQKQC